MLLCAAEPGTLDAGREQLLRFASGACLWGRAAASEQKVHHVDRQKIGLMHRSLLRQKRLGGWG